MRSGAFRDAARVATSGEPTARLADDANRLKKGRRMALASLLLTMIFLGVGAGYYVYFTPSLQEHLERPQPQLADTSRTRRQDRMGLYDDITPENLAKLQQEISQDKRLQPGGIEDHPTSAMLYNGAKKVAKGGLRIRTWLKPKALVAAERQVDRARNQSRSGADIAHLTRPDQNSLNLLVHSAQSGSREDQSRLGFVYAFGFGLTQNTAEAFNWWSKAAQEGDPDGEVDLGLMYATGEGVAKDYDEALSAHGEGVARNCGEALK